MRFVRKSQINIANVFVKICSLFINKSVCIEKWCTATRVNIPSLRSIVLLLQSFYCDQVWPGWIFTKLFTQIRNFFVTLGLNILSFLRLNVLFKSKYHQRLILPTLLVVKYLFLCEISSKIQVKVTKILRICVKMFL